MSLIKNLTDFLNDNLPQAVFRGRQFTSFTGDVEFKRMFSQITTGQLQAGILTYEAVLDFEKWPFRQINPHLLFLLVSVWVEQLEDSRLYAIEGDPVVDVDIIDDQLSDISISIRITENLYMKEDEKGIIPFNGKRYTIDNPIIWYNPENIEIMPEHAN